MRAGAAQRRGKPLRSAVAVLVVGSAVLSAATGKAQTPAAPQQPGASRTVVVRSGTLLLRGLLWRPAGRGPFPAVLFHHGSSGGTGRLEVEKPSVLGPVFARHGYVFLLLFRPGIGLSAGQGTADGVLMNRAFRSGGQGGRNRVQLRLLEIDEMNDAAAGLAFLRALPDVDARRIALAGHSFGGSLALLQSARNPEVRAAVVFSGSAYSWPLSPALRTSLLAAVRGTGAAIFFLHAANDYSVAPGEALAAEMKRLGKPSLLKIYPATGRTVQEGHDFVYSSVAVWEPDVISFLQERLPP